MCLPIYLFDLYSCSVPSPTGAQRLSKFEAQSTKLEDIMLFFNCVFCVEEIVFQ